MRNAIRYALPLLFLYAICAQAGTIADKLSAEKIENSVTVKPQEISPEQKRLQKLTDTPDKPIEGINVKVVDVNLSKKSSVTVEYAPELKQGDLIDNKEQTSVHYNLKF